MPDLKIEALIYRGDVVSIKYSLSGEKKSKFDFQKIAPYLGDIKPLGELTFKDLDGQLSVKFCHMTDFCVSAFIEDEYVHPYDNKFSYFFEPEYKIEDFIPTNEMKVNSLTINYVESYLEYNNLEKLKKVTLFGETEFNETHLNEDRLKKFILKYINN